MQKLKEKETDIVSAILTYLAYKKVLAWRNQACGIATKNGHYIRFGQKGIADIIGIMPNNSGKLLALEVKTQTGKLTEHQADFLADVVRQGGVGEVVRSIEDVQYVLDKNK